MDSDFDVEGDDLLASCHLPDMHRMVKKGKRTQYMLFYGPYPTEG